MKISIDSNLFILLMIVMPVCVYVIVTLIFEGIKSVHARKYEWLEVSEGRYACPRCNSTRIYKRKSNYCPDCGIELVHVIGLHLKKRIPPEVFDQVHEDNEE